MMCVTTNKKLTRKYFSGWHGKFLGMIQIQLVKPSFGHRESESIVVEKGCQRESEITVVDKRVDLDIRL